VERYRLKRSAEPAGDRRGAGSKLKLEDLADEIVWFDRLWLETASDKCPEMGVFRHDPIRMCSDSTIREFVIILIRSDGSEIERCCPKTCDVLCGKPSFLAAGFRRGFMGPGSCARVPLPPGRTAFLAVLLADFSLKTVAFGSRPVPYNGNSYNRNSYNVPHGT